MTTQATPTSNTDLAQHDREERAEIDESCRVPVLLFFGSAIFWLLLGTAFAFIASVKFHHVQFLTESALTTFGRIRPAHLDTVIYGWGSMAGIGTAIWLMARLCRKKVRNPFILSIGVILWDIGVAVGIIGILAGHSTGIEWLEFPTYAAILLFLAFALIAIWGIDMFANRQPGHVYVSQWYLIAALFWFPWLYSTVQILLLLHPVSGSVQAIINWWFAHNVLGLWFTPIGIATVYYMIPKVIGRPIHSYYLSILGFWSLALFYSWNGGHHLLGGPIPLWVQSASIIASLMMFIPVITVAINHHMTMVGHFHMLKESPTLRFIVFGAMSYTLASLQGSLMAIPQFNKLLHFTHHTIAHAHLGMYLFFTMVMFGGMYYIIPRLIGWEWPSSKLISIHFWCTALGSIMMFTVLTIAGFQQGFGLDNPAVPFSTITSNTLVYLLLRSVSGAVIAIGHIAFAVSFVLILFKFGEKRTSPTLFVQKEATR